MASKHFFIVGISGTTNSGKSTVTSRLKRSLSHVSTMCQDHYFKEPKDPTVPLESNGYENWDCLQALEMDKMLVDVKKWMFAQKSNTTPSLLIIEGFLIFNHSELASLFDKKYFIKVDYSSSAERRVFREYDPPDPPGYFENIVWPQYLKNLEEIQEQKDIEYIDGNNSLEFIYEKLLNDIKAWMCANEKFKGDGNSS